MMIELKQDKAIETYVTKARQYIDNFHIYLFIIKERQRKKNQAVVIYLPTNVISDFISLILNELKPPLPCARLSNFIAN